jgi:hypothetical protein
MSEAIKVLVSIRSINNKQITAGCQSVVQITESDHQIILVKPGEADNTKSFAFDRVFGEASQQAPVYEKISHKYLYSKLLFQFHFFINS